MRIYDITQPLTAETVVWPGDHPVKPDWNLRIEDGHAINLGSIAMSLHAGTHVDAPLHYQRDGAPADAFPPEMFIGPCRVVDCCGMGSISQAHLAAAGPLPARVLCKTGTDVTAGWRNPFTTVEPDVPEWLAAQGVRVLGTDAASVDAEDSKTLDAHHAFARAGVANVENLDLRDVQPGLYFMVGLPLRVMGMDAAPMRVLLFDAFG